MQLSCPANQSRMSVLEKVVRVAVALLLHFRVVRLTSVTTRDFKRLCYTVARSRAAWRSTSWSSCSVSQTVMTAWRFTPMGATVRPRPLTISSDTSMLIRLAARSRLGRLAVDMSMYGVMSLPLSKTSHTCSQKGIFCLGSLCDLM